MAPLASPPGYAYGHWFDQTRNWTPESTNSEAEALSTRPSDR